MRYDIDYDNAAALFTAQAAKSVVSNSTKVGVVGMLLYPGAMFTISELRSQRLMWSGNMS